MAFLVSLTAAVLLASPQAPRTPACEHFEKGAKLIQLHVYEAEGGTRAGVSEGVRELEAALDGGCPSREADAFRMLGDAAWVYASQHAVSRQERRNFEWLALSSYRKYVTLRPDDSHARFTLAMMLRGRESLKEVEELVRRDPNFAMGRLTLGRELVKRGNIRAGASHLAASARLFDPAQAEDYGDEVVELLEKHGRKKEAAEARKSVEAKKDEARTRRK